MVMERIRETIIQSDEPWNETEKKLNLMILVWTNPQMNICNQETAFII